LHKWYDFWDADLGKPVSGKAVNYNGIQGLFIREYDKGWVVYNNSGSEQHIEFKKKMTGVKSKQSKFNHTVPDSDGEIFLYN